MFPIPSMFWFSHFLSVILICRDSRGHLGTWDWYQHDRQCMYLQYLVIKRKIYFSLVLVLKYPLMLIVLINLTITHFFSTLFRVSLIALLFHLDISSRKLFPRLGESTKKEKKLDFKEIQPSKTLQGRYAKPGASFHGKNRFLQSAFL